MVHLTYLRVGVSSYSIIGVRIFVRSRLGVRGSDGGRLGGLRVKGLVGGRVGICFGISF